jgi:asparagine synthase (glutamine-hydrolysing)
MCGIAGIVGNTGASITDAIAVLRHRGPDGEGAWSGAVAGRTLQLGQTRLAIIDLSDGGKQPMWDERGQVGVVFNGEIYNYRELRRELGALGHAFRSASDTETLLRGYLQWGEDVVHHLRGMFAYALWDARHEELLVARDRLGIKPMYWAEVQGGLAFGSEPKALFALGVERRPAPGTLDRYLTYLYVPGPQTAFAGVHELLPAHRLCWTPRFPVRMDRYWEPPRWQPGARRDPRELARELRQELDHVVEQHMLSDVPLGAFLSGGLDSSTLVGLMARKSPRPVKTFCMTFGAGEELYDEREYAREASAWFGTEHTEIPVRPNLVELLPALTWHFDQPFGNPTALLTYELSRLTRQHVTVALAGDGGDEVFLGYPRYLGQRLAAAYAHVPARVRQALANGLVSRIPESTRGRHTWRRAREFLGGGALTPEGMYARWVGYFTPEQRAELLEPELRAEPAPEAFLEGVFARSFGQSHADRAAQADLLSFLPYNLLQYSDRMSMAHGLELRVPYCDHVLVERMSEVPASIRMRGLQTKWLFKQAVKDILPPAIRRRKKLGFNPPMGIWLNRDLRELVDGWLSPERLRERGIRPAPVARMVDAHRRGQRDFSLHIWALLVHEAWCRQLEKRSAAAPDQALRSAAM